MSDKFLAEMAGLKQEVLGIAYLGREMLKQSVSALDNRDIDLALWVISKKEDLAQRNHEIEDRIFSIIALYQPVAHDMRAIACSLKIVSASERIGRYGKDIANIVDETLDRPSVGNCVSIPHMADLVIEMIDDAIRAFNTQDLTILNGFSKRDDAVDALRYSIFRECVTYMMESPVTITQCTNYVMVARYLERCADHACKMAEKVHYMVTGDRIEIK